MNRRLWLALPALMLAACVATAHPARYYVSQPAHTIQSRYTTPVTVFIEDRTLMWMSGAMIRARRNDLEGGACGHVAKMVGDGYFVDSLIPGRGATQYYTPTHARFSCYTSEIPIHWHLGGVCELSTPETNGLGSDDVDTAYAVFPANLVMCGVGIDSVVAYRVRRR